MRRIFTIKIFLLLIVFLAFFLRFWDLGENPPSLTWDEAAWGYNAYSLGIDGRDEFGRFLPYDYLESFGDFKPPLYAYLSILPVKIFGLDEFSVRFPSALFGVLTVFLTYFLVLIIFKKQREKNSVSMGSTVSVQTIALFSSFFLAVSPWHIMLSRAAFEANVASFLIVFGIYSFLRGVSDKSKYLIFSAVAFVLSLYTFNTARVVSPILVLALAFGFREQLFNNKKHVIISVLIGLLLILPTLKFLFSPQASLRFKEVNIFSDIKVIERTNKDIENDKNAFWSRFIHNRRFAYSVEFLKHYLDNFNPSFLFIKGDGNPKFSTQDVGQMYFFDIAFFVFGCLILFKKKEGNWWILPIWMIVGILPAATSRETPHALRIETTLPTFQIITAIGLYYFLNWVTKLNFRRNIKILLLFFLFFFLFLNIFYYLYGYYKHYPFIYSREWQYGYKESIGYVKEVQDKYDMIYMTPDMGRPYIYYLFYTRTSPDHFRKTAKIKRDAFGFVTVESFDKYNFSKNLEIKKDNNKKIMVISASSQISDGAVLLKRFNTLDGSEVLTAYSLDK